MARLYESYSWLYTRYIMQKTTIVQMAEEARCSHMTIQRALEKHKLTRKRNV